MAASPDTPAGFNLYTKTQGGAALDNRSFASLVIGRIVGFYQLNILTGQVTRIASPMMQ